MDRANIFHHEAAFTPFFDERVAVRGARANGASVAGTFAACVFDEGFDEVFDETRGTSSRVRKISVTIPKAGPMGWNRKDPPQVGDEITVAHGLTFAVSDVALLFGAGDFVMEARQK